MAKPPALGTEAALLIELAQTKEEAVIVLEGTGLTLIVALPAAPPGQAASDIAVME